MLGNGITKDLPSTTNELVKNANAESKSPNVDDASSSEESAPVTTNGIKSEEGVPVNGEKSNAEGDQQRDATPTVDSLPSTVNDKSIKINEGKDISSSKEMQVTAADQVSAQPNEKKVQEKPDGKNGDIVKVAQVIGEAPLSTSDAPNQRNPSSKPSADVNPENGKGITNDQSFSKLQDVVTGENVESPRNAEENQDPALLDSSTAAGDHSNEDVNVDEGSSDVLPAASPSNMKLQVSAGGNGKDKLSSGSKAALALGATALVGGISALAVSLSDSDNKAN